MTTDANSRGSCRYCGMPAYLTDAAGPRHACCHAWRAVITAGYRCPSCQAARWLADPHKRHHAMPPLPARLPNGRPFTPDINININPQSAHQEGRRVTSPTLPYALAAAGRGWRVFPLAPGGKTPLRDSTDWERHATADPAAIRRFWTRPYNVGIATGPSRLVVVDLDEPKHGEHPPQQWELPGIATGADVFAALCEETGHPLPLDTFMVRTRRGGLHLYYAAPDGPALANTSGDHGNGLGWLIDTRASGGYVVGPGSRVTLPDGTGTYEVVHPGAPAPLPGWLADRLRPSPSPSAPSAPMRPLAAARSRYLAAALDAEVARVTDASEGQRNRALYLAAVALGQLVAGGSLIESDIHDTLTEAGRSHVAAGAYSARQAERTIASGLRAGAKRPRQVAA